MKIIFFGLGSIGKRHARILLKNFNHSLFAFRSNRKQMPNDMGIKELYSWEEIERLSPDVAFITNPTFLHIKTAIKCARLGINLFIEKPIDSSTDNLDRLIDLVRKKRLTTYVAYHMRFNPLIKRLLREVNGRKLVHCRIAASSYLPDWRPGRDYRDIYSAQKNKGGGAIFELSHEIDYSRYLFGDILKMQGVFGRISRLQIDSEDYADIIIRCKRAIVNLHLNFFSKNVERSIKIDFENSDYAAANLIDSTLIINKNGTELKYKYNFEKDDVYLEQLKFYFKNFNNRKMMNNLIDARGVAEIMIGFKKKYERQG